MTSNDRSAHPWSRFEIAYVTIEFETAFVVGAAESDHLFDAVFVTDANGLPCIPGESLAGVMRHAMEDFHGEKGAARCREVFGFQSRGDGQASKLRVSFAHVHNQKNLPVPFRGAPLDDPVLAFLAAGAGRDHVRIGKHGAVDERGKFDELVVPAGARFTFEISLAENNSAKVADLVNALQRPEVRLGGKSRRGFGRFNVVRVLHASFDLTDRTKPSDVDRLKDLPVAIDRAVQSKILQPMNLTNKVETGEGWVSGTLSLKPVTTWAIGGGMTTGYEPPRSSDKPYDRLPLTERHVVWDGDRGRLSDAKTPVFLVPGSSVKGALRHRAAFHARRQAGLFMGPDGELAAGADREVEAERELFGSVRSASGGEPGRVFISDARVTNARYVPQQHVSLDRFTQGPMDHLLFDELTVGQCKLELDVAVRVDSALSPEARRAFKCAVNDLCDGRLALGTARGQGRFRGKVVWTDRGQWIGGQDQ